MSNVDPVLAMAEADEQHIVHVESGAVGAIVKSEVEAQIGAAHRYPRSVAKFLREAATLATITQEIAESCIYSLPRGGKLIAGPSVRLAEIVASAYGNLHIGARVIEVDEKDVTAQGVAWDLEKNLRVSLETKRRITNKHGKRYDDDMITMTGNAAASIALRNAVFRVIPRSYVNAIYEKCRQVAVGNAQTLDARRAQVLERLTKIGVPQDRVLAKLEKRGVEDIGLEDLETLIGLGTAIKNGEVRIDEVFPPVAPAPAAPSEDGKRIKMGKGKSAASEPDPDPEPPADEQPDREPGED